MDFLILKNAKIWDFSSGGRRSDSRLGRRGKKLAESRKVGKSESRKVAKYIKKFRTVELSEMFCRVSFSTCRAAVDFMSS